MPKGVDDYLLQVHGHAPGKKREGFGRLLLENVNGLNTRIAGNDKLEKGKAMIDDLEPDIVAITEHRINLRHKANKNGFRQMFDGGEAEIRAVQAHNVTEPAGKVQEGGTAMLAITLLQHVYTDDFFGSIDSGTKQIGQSPRWLLSGCLNKNSSRNSAARFLHSCSC